MGAATTRRASRTIGFVVGLAALAAVPALGLGAYAAADTSSGGSTPDGEAAATPTATRPRHMLTDAQKQCLSDHGVTLPPTSDTTGGRPQLSPEQRAALRTAAQECGIALGGGRRAPLTDAQKQCLSDHGVTLPPTSDTTGGRPQLSPEQRAALRTAAQACGIELPHPGPRAEQPQTA